jgi:predicted ATPase
MVDIAPRGFIQHVEIVKERVPNFDVYPFSIGAVRALSQRLVLNPRATIFVGENGTGKSTVIEAIAAAMGFNPEGGSIHFSFSTRPSHSILSRCLRVARTERRPQTGYFLRAESFFNVATNIEVLDRDAAPLHR